MARLRRELPQRDRWGEVVSEAILGRTLPLTEGDSRALCRESLLLGGFGVSAIRLDGATLVTRSSAPLSPGSEACVCIGAFDGLHRGHRRLLTHAVADARALSLPCVAVTFSPDPSDLIEGEKPLSRLLEVRDRARGLLLLGADAVLVLDFGEGLEHTSQEAFLRAILPSLVRPRSVWVGTNFRFGDGGRGDLDSLRELGNQAGITVHGEELLQEDGQTVSATRIRSLLRDGQLERANALLARPHFVRGPVGHGRGEGTSFGFPTANVQAPDVTCVPSDGVYAGFVVTDGTAYPAAINVGAPPTFSGPRRSFLEANLLGFSGDLYGREVSVVFARWLRASRPFPSTEELERAVLANVDWVRTQIGQHGVEVGE